MRNYRDAKTMAKMLRHHLTERRIELSHSECLELVAKQFGIADWNTLSARIDDSRPDDRRLALPKGWFVAGRTDPGDYRTGLDPALPNTALIESVHAKGEGAALTSDKFAVLMQSIDAEEYRGRKLRLTVNLRTEAADLGTSWMRIDGPENASIRFDNMTTRRVDGALKGTTDWTERSIVLDVPPLAGSIHYGFFLQGHGRLWARHFRLEVVDADVATTADVGLHQRPTNLDFSEALPQEV